MNETEFDLGQSAGNGQLGGFLGGPDVAGFDPIPDFNFAQAAVDVVQRDAGGCAHHQRAGTVIGGTHRDGSRGVIDGRGVSGDAGFNDFDGAATGGCRALREGFGRGHGRGAGESDDGDEKTATGAADFGAEHRISIRAFFEFISAATVSVPH